VESSNVDLPRWPLRATPATYSAPSTTAPAAEHAVTEYSHVIRHRAPIRRSIRHRRRADTPSRIALAIALAATFLAALVPLALT
jgi:hypothetical protein